MNENAEWIEHPLDPNVRTYGYRLTEGDVLQATDLYDSSAVKWSVCPCPGIVIQSTGRVIWVRPISKNTD